MGDTSSSSGPLWLRVLRYNSVSAAISVVCATLVSTPPEVIKTRLQLQGELAAKNSAQELKYKGSIFEIFLAADCEVLFTEASGS